MATASQQRRSTASPAQAEYRKSIQDAIISGNCVEFQNDWTDIKPPRPKPLVPSFFDLKGIAAFVPHLLIKGFVPWCPKCKSRAHVDLSVESWRFAENPKPLFGLGREREFEYVRYECKPPGHQKHSFNSYDAESLRLGGAELLGMFRFYVSRNYAVDEQLHHFLTNSMFTPVAQLSRMLTSMVQQKYVNDLIEYYTCAIRGTVKTYQNGAPVLHHDVSQRKIQGFAVDKNNESADIVAARKLESNARRSLRNLGFKVTSVKQKAEDDIDLRKLLEVKGKKNEQTLRIASMGPAKIKELLDSGFTTGRQFVSLWRHERHNPRVLALLERRQQSNRQSKPEKLPEQWARGFEKEFATRQQLYETIKEQADSLIATLAEHEQNLAKLVSAQQSNNTDSNNSQNDQDSLDDNKQILPFSDVTDKNGYNAKFLSADRINAIIGSHFRDRKPLLQAKMQRLGGRILSLDFVYPLAKRIWVQQKDGTRFRPFKCLASIKNEDSLVIWWGMLKGDESIVAIQLHLGKLRARFIHLGYSLRIVIYVDNCCNVKAKIEEVWPEALVKLDHWHWFKRWDEAMVDPKSENGRLFKALMSRAVLVAPDDEVNRKRTAMMGRLKRVVTLQEVLRECDTVAPQSEEMKGLVWAVIDYFLKLDFQTEKQLSDWPQESTAPRPKLTFKRGAILQNVIRRQLAHVTKGCLSDPQHEHPDFADLSLYTKVGNKTYCARGSGSNERSNLALEQDVIAGVSQMGPGRAERGIWTRYNDWNDNANIKRKGAVNHRTKNTESLALGNSLAVQCGIETLPFKDVSCPTIDASAPQERMGFDTYAGFDEAADDDNNTMGDNDDNAGEDEDDDDDDGDDDGGDGDDGDGDDGDGNDGDGGDDDGGDDAIDDDLTPDASELNYAEDVYQQVREAIGPILNRRRYEGGRETTMEAFNRQTGGSSWVPISQDLKTKDKVDVEEQRYFNELESQFKRSVAPSAAHGYDLFAKAWEQEVGRRHLQAMAGDESIVLLRPKSVAQLQDHFDFLQTLERDAHHVTETEEANRRGLFSQLKRARIDATGQAKSVACAPITYPTATVGARMIVPFGAPTVHPQLFSHAFTQQQSTANQAPFFMNPPQPFVPPPRAPLVNYRIMCRVCLNPKRDHEKENGRLLFGSGRCTLSYCGRCSRTKIDHDKKAQLLRLPLGVSTMGPNCVFSNNAM